MRAHRHQSRFRENLWYRARMAKPPVDVDQLTEHVVAVLAQHPALPAAELRAVRKHIPALAARLQALGYEVTPKQIRWPLQQQLKKLATHATIPLKGLDKHVLGGSSAEIKVVIADLLARGELREVLRPAGPALATAEALQSAALHEEDLAGILRDLTQAQKLVRKALSAKITKPKPHRPVLLLADTLSPLLARVPSAALAAPPARPQDASSHRQSQTPSADQYAICIRLIASRSQTTSPLRVAEVLRELAPSPEIGKRALLEGVALGLFDLEPESGMGRLSVEDAAWCPQGPGGTLLSWIVARPGVMARSNMEST
jgi:hypothetical protein